MNNLNFTVAVNEGVGSLLYVVLLPWLPDVLLFLAEGLLRGSELLVRK